MNTKISIFYFCEKKYFRRVLWRLTLPIQNIPEIKKDRSMGRLMDSNLSWYWSLLSPIPHCDIDRLPSPRENRWEPLNQSGLAFQAVTHLCHWPSHCGLGSWRAELDGAGCWYQDFARRLLWLFWLNHLNVYASWGFKVESRQRWVTWGRKKKKRRYPT